MWVLTIIISLVTPDTLLALLMLGLNYALGMTMIILFCKKDNIKEMIKLYINIVSIYFLYTVFCNLIRIYNNWEFIGSWDGNEVYVPYALHFADDYSIKEIVLEILEYKRYQQIGSMILFYTIPVSIAFLTNSNIHYAMQLSLIGLTALNAVIFFHLLIRFDVSKKRVLVFSYIFALLGPCFLQCNYIVRDMPITLAVSCIIYLSFLPFSIKNLFYMLLCILVIASLRLATAICVSVLIIGYIVYEIASSSNIGKRSVLLIISLGILLFVFRYWPYAQELANEKIKYYDTLELNDQSGQSTLSMFNRLPFGISHIAKSVYDQLTPCPSWRNLSASTRKECYNIYRWPEILTTYTKYITLAFLTYFTFFSLASVKGLLKNKVFLLNILFACIFLCLQSMTMGDRRKMGVYVVFYLMAVYGWEHLQKEKKVFILLSGSAAFFIAQCVGIVFMG